MPTDADLSRLLIFTAVVAHGAVSTIESSVTIGSLSVDAHRLVGQGFSAYIHACKLDSSYGFVIKLMKRPA